MPIELHVDSKHEQSWNILEVFVVGIHNDFMLHFIKWMMPLFKKITMTNFVFGHEYNG
jgi:hypothetical protein